MKKEEIDCGESGVITYANLTYREHCDLSMTVMELLAQQWLSGALRGYLRTIYMECSGASGNPQWKHLKFAQHSMEYWSGKIREAKGIIIAVPDITEDGNFMKVNPAGRYQINQVWKQAYTSFRTKLRSLDNFYNEYYPDIKVSRKTIKLTAAEIDNIHQYVADVADLAHNAYHGNISMALQDYNDRTPFPVTGSNEKMAEARKHMAEAMSVAREVMTEEDEASKQILAEKSKYLLDNQDTVQRSTTVGNKDKSKSVRVLRVNRQYGMPLTDDENDLLDLLDYQEKLKKEGLS